jgi:hypothetical protein
MFLNFKELSHQKVYIAPLQNESISIAVPSKADEYKIHCISCNVQLYSCEFELHLASCRQSSDTDSEPTQNEVEVGKRLLEELIEREMRASKASAQVNVAYWNIDPVFWTTLSLTANTMTLSNFNLILLSRGH